MTVPPVAKVVAEPWFGNIGQRECAPPPPPLPPPPPPPLPPPPE